MVEMPESMRHGKKERKKAKEGGWTDGQQNFVVGAQSKERTEIGT